VWYKADKEESMSGVIGLLAYWAIVISVLAMLMSGIAGFISGLVLSSLYGGIADIEAKLAPKKRSKKKKVELTGLMAMLAARFPRLEERLKARLQPKPVKELTDEEREELAADGERMEALLPRAKRWNSLALRSFDIAVIVASAVAVIVMIIGSVVAL
jgi:uncharacterized membrane protein